MKILVIEDEPGIAAFIRKGLTAECFVVDVATDGLEGAKMALMHPYDAVILDLHLPGMHGKQVAERIREHKQSLPILVLSVDADLDEKVGLLGYCDDYVTKPFSLKELVARVRAVLRRSPIVQGDILEVGDLRLDARSCRVYRGGAEITLRNKEFALLEFLMRHAGTVLSRHTILEHVWDMNVDPFTNTVDVHIRQLRKKIDKSYTTKLIHTIPRRGYMIQS